MTKTKILSTSVSLPQSYKTTFQQIKKRINESRYKAFRAVNKELIELYWDLGKTIVEKQEKENWGKSVVKELAKDLEIEIEFEGVRGFSLRNLWYMRDFYKTYKSNTKLQQLVAEIGWGHNIMIMSRCKDPLQQEFYVKMAIREGWSRSILEDRIKTQEYERWALKQTNFDKTLVPSQARKAESLVKDDYNFDFLLIDEESKERQLETEILAKIRPLLIEMGTYFSFVGNQVKLTVGGDSFYLDLLFYHRALKSLIVIELKTGEFKAEYAGKMAMYLTALEEEKSLEGENSPIGIIVCKTKNRTLVEYTLKTINRPVGVENYKTYKDKKELPPEMAKYLPGKEEIIRRLVNVMSK